MRLRDLRIFSADISDILKAHGTFSGVLPKHSRDRHHRTDCAAFRFLFSIFGGLCECIGR
jgi:hypothetical protein